MLKNITLSAEEKLIEKARRRAEKNHTTLNAEFRRWLEQYASAPQSAEELASLTDELCAQQSPVQPGRKE